MESIVKNDMVMVGDMDEHDLVGASTTTRTPSHHDAPDTAADHDAHLQQQQQQSLDVIHRLPENDVYEENCINLSLLDPARYGWMAMGGIADVSTPHEVGA